MSGVPETAAPPSLKPAAKPNNPDKPEVDRYRHGNSFYSPSNPLWLIPVGLTALAAPSITPTSYRVRPPGAEPEVPPTPDPTASPCRGNGCGGANLSQSRRNSAQLGAIEGQLGGLQAQLAGLGIGADAVGNAAIMARLNAIDAKLGAQLPNGGISALLGNFWERFKKFADWMQLDRVLNLLTLFTAIHNATMLSNALKQTLFSAISNGLAAAGIRDFTQSEEGTPFDVNAIVNKYLESTIKGAIGAENYLELSGTWKKANRIYQSAANLLFSIQSIAFSILSVLEVIGGWTAKIGNALQKWRVVGEGAFAWMNPTPNFQNRFFTNLQNATEVVSQVDQIASEVYSSQQTVENIFKQKEDIAKAVSEDPARPPSANLPDAAQVKAREDAAKLASQAPQIQTADQVKPGG